MRNIVFPLIFLLVCSCNRTSREDYTASSEPADNFFEIDYEGIILQNKKSVTLSEVASDVEYIKLETNDDCMIRRVSDCFYTDSLVLIGNRDHVLKFSRTGKFIERIGNPGRGPGEIDLIRTMTLIPDERMIAVQKNAKREMLYLSFEGEVVKTVKIPYGFYVKVVDEGRYIAYDPGTSGSNENTFSLINEKGETISVIENYCTWENTSGIEYMIGSWPQPFSVGDRWFFKDKYNDTVYTVIEERIRPSYSVNMGRYKLPDELRLERLLPDKHHLLQAKAQDYYNISLFEAADILFMVSDCYGQGEGKYILYDKNTGTGTLLASDSDLPAGFVNDWDGGIDFWPAGSVNGNQVYMPVDITTLKNELEKAEPGERTVNYPGKQKQLEEIINSSDISDNPLLMIVTLKDDLQF